MDTASTQTTYPVCVTAVLKRISSEVSAAYCYHDFFHTNEVISEVIFLADRANLPPRDRELLLIAAAFHDSGFMVGSLEHEQRGAEMAAQAMRSEHGYSDAEIALVAQMIRDTKLTLTARGVVQVPTTRLSPYLCDADLANLGKPICAEKTELIRRELRVEPSVKFYSTVRKMLLSHVWLTLVAQELWSEEKARNIERLDRLIEKLSRPGGR